MIFVSNDAILGLLELTSIVHLHNVFNAFSHSQALNIYEGGFIMMITYSKGNRKIQQDYSDLLSQAIVKEVFNVVHVVY